MSHGHRIWVVSAGCIPIESHGDEPEFVSQDRLSLLNAGADAAKVTITIYYEHRDPVGPYQLEIQSRRVWTVKIGDLIAPEAVPLGVANALVVRSDTPVIVQFERLDSAAAVGRTLTTAFPA